MNIPQEHLELGQFIPLIYHYNMLADQVRMNAFREAIAVAVPQGSRELVQAARRILALNPGGEHVEVIEADAFDYLPPEPVDVVICEMLHVGMLREKQIPVIESFKRRYLEKFGAPLPCFVPEAFIQAVQPVQQSFDFGGYHAPSPLLQDPSAQQPRTKELGAPVIYQVDSYENPLPMNFSWQGELAVEQSGQLNALRFTTKNVLTIVEAENRSIDWFSQYLIVPLDEPLTVHPGQRAIVSFAYQPGAPIATLRPVVKLIH